MGCTHRILSQQEFASVSQYHSTQEVAWSNISHQAFLRVFIFASLFVILMSLWHSVIYSAASSVIVTFLKCLPFVKGYFEVITKKWMLFKIILLGYRRRLITWQGFQILPRWTDRSLRKNQNKTKTFNRIFFTVLLKICWP